MHFCSGLLLALSAILWSWLILLPFVAGVVKEVLDKYVKKTGFEVKDMFIVDRAPDSKYYRTVRDFNPAINKRLVSRMVVEFNSK